MRSVLLSALVGSCCAVLRRGAELRLSAGTAISIDCTHPAPISSVTDSPVEKDFAAVKLGSKARKLSMVACAEVGEPGKIVLLALNYEASGAYAGGAIVYPGANAGHKHAPGSADMALAVLTLTGDAKANTPLGRVLTGDLAKADTLELRFPTAAAAATAWAWATGQAANPAAPACAALSSTMARVGVVQDPPAHIAHECLAAFQAELPAEVSKLPGTFFRGKLPDQWLALQNAGDAAIVAAVEATLLHGPAVDALIAENREPQAATTGPAFIAGLGAVLLLAWACWKNAGRLRWRTDSVARQRRRRGRWHAFHCGQGCAARRRARAAAARVTHAPQQTL